MRDRPDLAINTGPLLALIAAEELEVLPRLFKRIVVPHEVAQEVEAGGLTGFAQKEFRSASWLEKRSRPTELTPFLQSALDLGEAAVIALALTEKISTVAIDETVGRRIARLHGLQLTGSLGILLRAKQEGMPVKIRTAIAKMRGREIWLSKALEAECLRLAGEGSLAESAT